MTWDIHNLSIIDLWLELCISAKVKRKGIFINLEYTQTENCELI